MKFTISALLVCLGLLMALVTIRTVDRSARLKENALTIVKHDVQPVVAVCFVGLGFASVLAGVYRFESEENKNCIRVLLAMIGIVMLIAIASAIMEGIVATLRQSVCTTE